MSNYDNNHNDVLHFEKNHMEDILEFMDNFVYSAETGTILFNVLVWHLSRKRGYSSQDIKAFTAYDFINLSTDADARTTGYQNWSLSEMEMTMMSLFFSKVSKFVLYNNIKVPLITGNSISPLLFVNCQQKCAAGRISETHA